MPKKAKASQTKQIYQVKITLNHTNPPIWRRVLVPDNVNLEQFHIILQIAMDWYNEHMHQFSIGGKYYLSPETLDRLDDSQADETKYRLSDLGLKEKDKFVYEYDMGDGWEHQVVIEKILPVDAGNIRPVILAGELNCPPEDCGGIHRYYRILEIIRDPKHPEYEETMEWLGGKYDPDKIDLVERNKYLRVYCKSENL